MPAKDNTALVALVAFVATTVICGALAAYFWHGVAAEEVGLDAVLQKAQGDRRNVENETEGLLQKVVEKKADLTVRKRVYYACLDDLRRAKVDQKLFQSKVRLADEYVRSLRLMQGSVNTTIQSGDGEGSRRIAIDGLRERKDQVEAENAEESRKLRSELDDIRQRIVKENEVFAKEKEQYRKILGEYSTLYNNYRAMLEKMTAREEIHVGLDEDGRVIRSDLDSRLAVIDLGSSAGVKKGFRFEIFQIQQGNRRVHKGYLEVKSLEPETATCTILVHTVPMPRCPICGYVGENRFERFCPDCSGGETGFGLQRLSGSPKWVEVGMNRQDPIVGGDYVYNPFFDRGEELTFAVKGQALLPEKFGRDYIMDLIRWHGAVVEDEVSAKSDYLVAGKWASEDVKKARELGVKVLNQFDLFEFFER